MRRIQFQHVRSSNLQWLLGSAYMVFFTVLNHCNCSFCHQNGWCHSSLWLIWPCLFVSPPALALILTNGNQKQQNINFIPKQFLLFNLLLSCQELHYNSISSVSHVALIQALCLILCNLESFLLPFILHYLCFSCDFPYGIKWLCLLFCDLGVNYLIS